MTTYYRIQKKGGMTYWVKQTPLTVKDPVLTAVRRVVNTTSSNIAREHRRNIMPNAVERTCDFVGIAMRPEYHRIGFSSYCLNRSNYTLHTFVDYNDNVTTARLNEVQLYWDAGRIDELNKEVLRDAVAFVRKVQKELALKLEPSNP